MPQYRVDPFALPVPRLTRRRLIAGLGATGIGVAAARPGLAAGRLLDPTQRYPSPTEGQTYYTRSHDLAQTRGPNRLATWLEREHLEYQLGGWFFFGRLVGDAGPDDLAAFLIALQRVPVQGVDFMAGGVGFRPKGHSRYEYAPVVFPRDLSDNRVVVRSDPWVASVRSPDHREPLIRMKTISGRMGARGTRYLLEADIPADLNPRPTGRIRARVRVRDRFGVINQGYGATAFCPQFLTPAQKRKVTNAHGGSVRDYLKETGDPMICQGSWYYQLPFLEVERFTVTVGDSLRSEGRRGLLWMDQLVQTYDRRAAAALLDSKYEFFAIQFPDEHSALMVLHVDGANGRFPVATYYDNSGGRGPNDARRPTYSWPITGIDIEPDPSRTWRSPFSGYTYNLRYRIRLRSREMSADLTITMTMKNQEFQEQAGGLWDYEGIGDVKGRLNGRRVDGHAFLEAVPATKSPPR